VEQFEGGPLWIRPLSITVITWKSQKLPSCVAWPVQENVLLRHLGPARFLIPHNQRVDSGVFLFGDQLDAVEELQVGLNVALLPFRQFST